MYFYLKRSWGLIRDMSSMKSFFYKFCVMFTVITITYGIFNVFTSLDEIFHRGFLQCLGLAVIFAVVLTALDSLSNKIKLLASDYFVWIQYLILVTIIVSWAILFRWGDWNNIWYIIIFVGSFTLIYLFVYFFIDLSNKEEDDRLNQQLKKYQKDISDK